MHHHRRVLALLLTAGSGAPAIIPAQQVVVRSDDGGAILTLGAPASAAVRVIRLPDGDDVAGVVGSHYRIETTVASLPANSVLAIQWDSAGLPGGVSAGSLALMRHAGDDWTPTDPGAIANHSLAGAVTAPGDFAVRWTPRQRCLGEAYHALDFRLGSWDYRATGYTPGRSDVTRDPSQCALHDHYLDQQGARSTSLFLFDPGTARWYNTTIDPGGRSISSGRVEHDGIAFYHSPTEREVYQHREDGTITFSGERSSDNGASWKVWATATYTSVPPPRKR